MIEITTELITQVSLAAIIVAVVIIVLSLLILLKKPKEEAHAKKILKKLKKIKKTGVLPSKTKSIDKEKSSEEVKQSSSKKEEVDDEVKEPKKQLNKDDTSLKDLLAKKFKPKIESQLKSKIKILGFSPQEKDFVALVEISGVKISLTLDSAGKIIDYKKVKA